MTWSRRPGWSSVQQLCHQPTRAVTAFPFFSGLRIEKVSAQKLLKYPTVFSGILIWEASSCMFVSSNFYHQSTLSWTCFFFFFNFIEVYLIYNVNFCYIAKWLSYIYIYIHTHIYTHTHTHIIFLFFFLTVLNSMWDPSSISRAWTPTPCFGSTEF